MKKFVSYLFVFLVGKYYGDEVISGSIDIIKRFANEVSEKM